jgi:pimeloyl-ACP methyl ester carboxylesterase
MLTATALQIAFDDLGDGDPTLLFMPGWCGHRTVYRPLLPETARTHRSVALDWRGHGGSDVPEADYGTRELVADALAVIDRAGIDRVVPVSIAHAGWVAIALREELGPDRVPGIVLLDWMVLGPPPGFLDALAGLQDANAWEKVRAGLFAMWTEGIDLPSLDTNIAEMANHGFDDWARGSREIAAGFALHGSPLAALEALQPCPTLHLYAQPNAEEFFAAQQAFAREHAWFSVERLEAKSHFPPLEAPVAVAAAIDQFVGRL